MNENENVNENVTNVNMNAYNAYNKHAPFTEKYRASQLTDVILNASNRRILKNIIAKQHFPNLLLYGPPGTGKTTTIINLINEYQSQWTAVDKRSVIHLNASDDRGIEIIRNQIHQFVNSQNLFSRGLKFVVLDEVDYMTKNAQQALRYLIQLYSGSVRFCLICNYMSRLDEGLQNELVRLNFNRLPAAPITEMLTAIAAAEHIPLTAYEIESIRTICGSDVRSMINYIQSAQTAPVITNPASASAPVPHKKQHIAPPREYMYILNCAVWEYFYNHMEFSTLQSISVTYQCDRKRILKGVINYIIRNKPFIVSQLFLSVVEIIMHLESCKSDHYARYAVAQLHSIITPFTQCDQHMTVLATNQDRSVHVHPTLEPKV